MSGRLAGTIAGTVMLVLAAGCTEDPQPAAGPPPALYVDPAGYDFSENPPLLERIKSDPHGYFRFVNIPFGQAVCNRYRELMDRSPRVNLHGDAHLEQYAVTDLGRGLTDFDDSSTGPGLLDVMRFGVSLRLTCRLNGWDDRYPEILERFLSGYRDSLLDPELRAPEPSVVTAIRSGFSSDRAGYFQWVESIMEPAGPEFELRAVEAFQPYAQRMLEENPELPSDFFQVSRIGYLRLGIGSALDLKFLVRVRGPSADPNDDVVLEVKEVRNLEGIDCVQAGVSDPFRILLSQARIAYKPFQYLGYLRLREGTFWIHSWVENYEELSVNESFQNPEQLAEVAYDVGVQLGLGHPKQIGAPFGAELRRSQWSLLDRNQQQLAAACEGLAAEVVEAWQRFREQAP